MIRPIIRKLKSLPRVSFTALQSLREPHTRTRIWRTAKWLLPLVPITLVAYAVNVLLERMGHPEPIRTAGVVFVALLGLVAVWRLRRKLPWIIPAFVMILAGYILAVQIRDGQPGRVILSVVGFILLGVFVARIDLALITMLIITDTIMYPTFVPSPFKIGGGGFGAGELLLVLMIFVGFAKAHKNKRPVYSPLMPPVLLFFLSVLFALFVGYRAWQANPRGFYRFDSAYLIARAVFYYTYFFAIFYGIKDKKQYRFVFNASLVLGCFVAVVMVVQYVVGENHRLFLGVPESAIQSLGRLGEERDVTRAMAPGLPLNLLILITCLYLAAEYRGRVALRYSLLATILGAGVVFSFSRSTWTSLALAVLVILLITPIAVKGRALGLIGLALAGSVLFSIALAPFSPGRAAAFQKAFVDRATSIVKQETYNTGGIRERSNENRRVMRQIRKSPFFGIGLGQTLVSSLVPSARDNRRYLPSRSDKIHNSYINLWAQYGVLGVVAYAWISITFLWRAMLLWRRADEVWIRGIGLGFALTYIGFLMRSGAQMSLIHQTFEIAVAAYMWGMVEVGHILAVRNPMRPAELDPVEVRSAAVSYTS